MTEATRAYKMRDLRLRGWTLASIASHFSVTKEWVRREILTVSDEGDRELYSQAARWRKTTQSLQRASTYRDMLRVAFKANTTPLALFLENDLDPEPLVRARHEYVHGLLNHAGVGKTFSREDILGALTHAAEQAGVESLSAGIYNEHRREGDPSHQLVIGRFGSWNAAIAEAGLKPRRGPHGDTPHQVWGMEIILSSVAEFFAQQGWDSSSYSYDRWVGDRQLPSASVVISRLGGWSSARLETLPRLLEDGGVLISGETWERDHFPLDVLDRIPG